MVAAETTPRPGGGPSDAALVVAARAGEAWACEVLYRRHAAVAHGLACRLMGRDAEVDDLVQDAFLVAFTTLDRLEDGPAFRSWLCGIVVRRTCKLLRRRRLLARLGLRSKEPPPSLDKLLGRSTPPDVALELRRIYAALEELPTDLRAAFLLRRVEGSTLEEVAALTGASLATVKRRIARAKELLAGKLEMEGSDD